MRQVLRALVPRRARRSLLCLVLIVGGASRLWRSQQQGSRVVSRDTGWLQPLLSPSGYKSAIKAAPSYDGLRPQQSWDPDWWLGEIRKPNTGSWPVNLPRQHLHLFGLHKSSAPNGSATDGDYKHQVVQSKNVAHRYIGRCETAPGCTARCPVHEYQQPGALINGYLQGKRELCLSNSTTVKDISSLSCYFMHREFTQKNMSVCSIVSV